MNGLVESILQDDHHSLSKLLVELRSELTQGNIVRSFYLLDLFWARLAVHIRAENLALFPALADVPASQFNATVGLPSSGEVQELFSRLRSDHDFFMKELALMIKIMRRMKETDSSTSSELEDLRERLDRIDFRLSEHNRLEEEQIYKWPLLLLDAQALAELSERVRKELDNMPPRFE